MTYYFSETQLGFFCSEVNESIPDDAVQISDEHYLALLDGQSDGKVIAADADGNPLLTFPPEPTRAQLTANAQTQKAALMAKANAAIIPLQDAADLGLDTDEERELLLGLKKYRVLLNRVDVTNAPDIEWPVLPE